MPARACARACAYCGNKGMDFGFATPAAAVVPAAAAPVARVLHDPVGVPEHEDQLLPAAFAFDFAFDFAFAFAPTPGAANAIDLR